jgi:amidase/aspartyl-tRNA(Asn)/glutamyl-tRNA(Gln) amidotransferase subunit A
MTDDQPLTAERVASLADRVGIETTPERTERILTEITGGQDGYARLLDGSDGWAQSADRDLTVVHDPDEDADPHNAFISLFELGGDGDGGPLDDLTLTLKDNISVGGVRLTGGSAVFADAVPRRDAPVVTRLLDAGATIRGKSNMDELAYGPTGETSAFGPARNPVAEGRITGGSSAGSAAAVAAGQVDAALGTDTGGSVRMPAAFCGLVGMKPTWGLVPQEGVIELCYTLDHVGPLARDVRTAARVLETIADTDERGTSVVDAVSEPPALESLTVGVPAEFYGDFVSETVARTVRGRIDAMADAGATVRDVSIPLFEDAIRMWNAVTNVEFALFLGAGGTPLFRRGAVDPWWHRDAVAGIEDSGRTFGDVVQRKAVEGTYLLAEEHADHYVAARNGCRALAAQFESALGDCDVLVTPTMASEPVECETWSPHSYSSAGENAAPPLAVNTRPANLAGLPALTVPANDPDTDPIGVQFIGSAGEDATVLAVGAAFETLVAD